MKLVTTTIRFSQAALLGGALLCTSSTMAASQCRGIQQDACNTSSECVWVNGYVRKDGRSVSSHCKSRGGKKAASRVDRNAPKLSAAGKP